MTALCKTKEKNWSSEWSLLDTKSDNLKMMDPETNLDLLDSKIYAWDVCQIRRAALNLTELMITGHFDWIPGLQWLSHGAVRHFGDITGAWQVFLEGCFHLWIAAKLSLNPHEGGKGQELEAILEKRTQPPWFEDRTRRGLEQQWKLKGLEKMPLQGPQHLNSHLCRAVPQKMVWACFVLTLETNKEQNTQAEGQ